MDENIGLKIKKLRKERKDTLKSLAEKIDYDWSNLSKVERGIYTASLELLRKIVEVYGINPNYFFDGLTDSEGKLGKLVVEEDADIHTIKEKFKLVVDGVEATDDEITAAIRLIRQIRPKQD